MNPQHWNIDWIRNTGLVCQERNNYVILYPDITSFGSRSGSRILYLDPDPGQTLLDPQNRFCVSGKTADEIGEMEEEEQMEYMTYQSIKLAKVNR